MRHEFARSPRRKALRPAASSHPCRASALRPPSRKSPPRRRRHHKARARRHRRLAAEKYRAGRSPHTPPPPNRSPGCPGIPALKRGVVGITRVKRGKDLAGRGHEVDFRAEVAATLLGVVAVRTTREKAVVPDSPGVAAEGGRCRNPFDAAHGEDSLVFLAADKTRFQDLDAATRAFLAWKSIVDDQKALNLDPQQVRQAENQKNNADATVSAQIPETYQWLLVPQQKDNKPESPVEWQTIKLSGQESLAVRASRKLRSGDLLVPGLAGSMLRAEMDRIPLWRGNDHVAVKQLVEDFARYPYLPRLQDPAAALSAPHCRGSHLTLVEPIRCQGQSFPRNRSRHPWRGSRTCRAYGSREQSHAEVHQPGFRDRMTRGAQGASRAIAPRS